MHNVEKGRMIVETKMYTLIMSCGRGTHVLVGPTNDYSNKRATSVICGKPLAMMHVAQVYVRARLIKAKANSMSS
jgi:hypothetical protein